MREQISFLNGKADDTLHVYSSDQWFKCIDRIMGTIVTSLIEQTSIVEHYVSQLVVYQHNNKKRHLSIKYNWEDSIQKMLEFLAVPTYENFKTIDLDRGYTQAMIYGFRDVVKGYEDTYYRVLKNVSTSMVKELHSVDDYHLRVGKKAHVRDLIQLVNHVGYMTLEMERFRHMILENYTKYIIGVANSDSASSPLMASREDMQQIYYLAANKAINHFNSNKGTFKSYLDIWIKKYRNSSESFRNLAYTAPNGVRANNFYVAMDKMDDSDEQVSPATQVVSDDLTDTIDSSHNLERITQLVDLVDKERYSMTALGLA